MMLSNGWMVLRLQVLSNGRTKFFYISLAMFIACLIPMLVFTGFTVNDFYNNARYSFHMGSCIILRKPNTYIGIYTSMSAFNLFSLILMIVNARRSSQGMHILIIAELNRHGAYYLVVLTVLSFMNLMIITTVDAVEMFTIVFFTWAMVSITMSRVFLQVEALKAQAQTQASTRGNVFVFQLHDMQGFQSLDLVQSKDIHEQSEFSKSPMVV
ncbi:hypothetical protein C8Q75DRAFT_520916 [Abortiporus biennis]|nr:hypothetical protein C8Q75DRAFT_520916 [Abortiporus biennis]